MEKFDETLEKRVWQRVHGMPDLSALPSLAAAEQNQAATYLALSRILQGNHKNLLRQLYQRERSHNHCIGGICRLTDGRSRTKEAPLPIIDRPETALRKCYAQTLKAMQAYRQLENDAEYGHVFQVLSHEEAENCRLLLQILGQ